jgi:hypothetical protein
MATCPTPSAAPRRVIAYWAMAMLFFASFLGALSMSLWTADQLVLRWVYGPEAVEREHLRIVHRKPFPQASNGDNLERWNLAYFLISSAVCVPLSIGLLVVLVRLLPQEYRELAGSFSRGRPPPGSSALLFFSPSFIAFFLVLTVGMVAASVATAALALAVGWMTAGRPGASPESAAGRR